MSTEAVRRLRRPGRTPGTVNAGIVVAVLALLLPLILHAATQAPPTAAEFSPNAQQVIRKPPPGTGASSNGTGGAGQGQGKGPGKGPGGGAGPGGSPTPTPPPQGDALECVGPPPYRQIEDPQSPPCRNHWVGNNGGVTAQGVTGSTIYIAVPTPNGYTQEYTALQNFFNDRFEFYGRKVKFEYCSPTAGSGSQGSGDQANQKADAQADAGGCAGDPPPFASTFYQFDNGRYFNTVMACDHHIITVASYTPFDTTYMNQCPGYLYQYPMVAEDMFTHVGDWACSQLVGRKATEPGVDATLKSSKRKFGIFLAPYYADDPIARRSALDSIVNEMNACGAAISENQIIINPVAQTNSGQALDPTSAQNAITQMSRANVSTIFCFCGLFPFGTLARAASSNGYHPEWIATSYGNIDNYPSLVVAAAPADEMQNLFGLTFLPRQINPLLEPYSQAFEQGDPSIGPQTSSADDCYFNQIYRPLLVLMSGIQMAGPHLTQKTFMDALRSTQFPNPITSTHAGAVGVPQNGYSFTDDAAEWWYSNTAQGPYSDDTTAKGAICYVEHGRRYNLGQWPKSAADVFDGTCDSGA